MRSFLGGVGKEWQEALLKSKRRKTWGEFSCCSPANTRAWSSCHDLTVVFHGLISRDLCIFFKLQRVSDSNHTVCAQTPSCSKNERWCWTGNQDVLGAGSTLVWRCFWFLILTFRSHPAVQTLKLLPIYLYS